MTNFRLTIVLVFSLLLLSCGGTPKAPVAKTPVQVPVEDTEKVLEPESEIQQIKHSLAQITDPQTKQARTNEAIIALAWQYHSQKKCLQVNAMLALAEPFFVQANILSQSKLLKADCELQRFINDPQSELSQAEIDMVAQWLSSIEIGRFDIERQAQYFLTLSKYQSITNNYAQALLSFFRSNPKEWSSQQDTIDKIWNWLANSSLSQRRQVASQYPVLLDYLALLDIVEDKGINDATRKDVLDNWLLNNQNSYLSQNLPSPVQQYNRLTQNKSQKIAVLLPLSGRLNNQGQAIKDGILASYYKSLQTAEASFQDKQIELQFFDTGSLPSLSEDINASTLNGFDTIIGPLLKSHIELLSRLSLPVSKQIFLNYSDDTQTQQDTIRIFYSLSPEEEARQLFELMRSRGVLNPVLIRNDTNLSLRMTNAFEKAWSSYYENEQTSNSLTIVKFTDNKSMKIGITSSLDTLQSQRRIQQLSRLDSDQIYSVTRNRRDIDAFVVFAQPDELELINPIIESSISLFSDKQLPVFASSHSFDHKQSKNSQRDLRNLVFVDMPFVSPDYANSNLKEEVNALFNQPSTQYLRLFSFGYDSLNLADNVAQLSAFQHTYYKGLSGTLSIAEDKRLSRELISITVSD